MFKPTYEEIREKVFKDSGIKVNRSCYIAEVMRAYGLTTRTAWNTGRGKGSPECPVRQYQAIEKALRDLGAIKK
ncbi:MAG: hypothetical protein A2Y92_00345 [Chloroflexi bacterium RBG_13_57_8]|nr:MAG: hypothetical protein A2Y92_00345 [Chloroflexi bacterium RBG_13_57_8]